MNLTSTCINLLTKPLSTKTTSDGDTFYEADFRSIGSYALLSTTSIASRETRTTGGKQAQWIRDVKSGPWPVTMLEVKKGIQDVPFCLVGQMLKL
jgi:hypothetical protein